MVSWSQRPGAVVYCRPSTTAGSRIRPRTGAHTLSDTRSDPFDVPAAARALGDALGVGAGSGSCDAPEVLLVLGSGLSGLADSVESPTEVSFTDVPGFPPPGVQGHAGRYLAGRLEGRSVLVQAGRFHVYEGHGMDVVAAPVRVAAELGIGTVVLTNAAGGIAPELEPGSLMLIEDHINLQWRSALAGAVVGEEQRFPDMSEPYAESLRARAREAAAELGVTLYEGVYAAVAGPSFETPAEVRMLQGLGADAIGMSTVPEAIVARALGMRVLAFSMISNRASGLGDAHLDHEEVLETGRQAGAVLEGILRGVLRRMEG